VRGGRRKERKVVIQKIEKRKVNRCPNNSRGQRGGVRDEEEEEEEVASHYSWLLFLL